MSACIYALVARSLISTDRFSAWLMPGRFHLLLAFRRFPIVSLDH